MNSESESDYVFDLVPSALKLITYYTLSDLSSQKHTEKIIIRDFERNKNRFIFTINDPLYFPNLTDAEFDVYFEMIITNNLYEEIKGITSTISYKSSFHHLKILFQVYDRLQLKPMYGSLMFHYVLSSEYHSTDTKMIIDFLLDKYANGQIEMVLEQSTATHFIDTYMHFAHFATNTIAKNVFLFASNFNTASITYFCNQCNTYDVRVPNFILDGVKDHSVDFNFWIEFYEKIDRYDGCKLILTTYQLDLLSYDLNLMFRFLTCVIDNGDKDFIDSFEIDMDPYNSYNSIGTHRHTQSDFHKLVELVREYKFKVTFHISYTVDDLGDLSIENLLAVKRIGRLNRMVD